MTGVASVIAARKAAGSGALIGYLPAGFPDLRTSIEAAVAIAENGVDVIELGLPYSDPVMDGSVIQAATLQALNAGFRIRDGIDAVAEITSRVNVPVLVMTYWNPVVQYGVDRFADELLAADGSGLITPDLIPDEGAEWIAAAELNDLDRVFLVAPSSTSQRLRSTTSACRGFVYAASTMGVTGARTTVGDTAEVLVTRARLMTETPICVGLGVSTGAQAAQVAAFADGVIVGSALVRCLADAVSRAEGLAAVRKLSTELAAGVRAGR